MSNKEEPTLLDEDSNSQSARKKKRVKLSLIISLAGSAFLTLLIKIPFIGTIPFLLTFPLHSIWPELKSTGEMVEYGFLWITIKQNWLWPVFFVYFFLILFASTFLLTQIIQKKPSSKQR